MTVGKVQRQVREGRAMKTVHVRKKIDSETLHLPELAALIGKPAEIFIVELPPASREEFFAEAVSLPETPEGRAAQAAKFRAWRQDPQFEHFWPALDRYLAEDAQDQAPPPAREEPAA
jgi:hypothetical protein